MSVCEISIINSLICQKLGSVGTVQQKIKLFSLFINLESFSKSTFVFFFIMYDFSKASWSNLIIHHSMLALNFLWV